MLALLVAVLLPATVWAKGGPKKRELERYPASFRLKIEEAIENGVLHLRSRQGEESGCFGAGQGPQALGHTALPTLAMLKAGVPADDPAIVKAFDAMRGLPADQTYSVAVYLMAIHAKYAPKLDTFDTDIGTTRAKRVKPDEVFNKLSDVDKQAMEAGADFLIRAQNARGLWHYGLPASDADTGFDLSNVQYALLGLRAAADSGIRIKDAVWLSALAGVLETQDAKGEEVELTWDEVRGRYAVRQKEKVQTRPFRYRDGKKDGPLGEKTVPTSDATGSMTTAGVACVAICREALWGSRRFNGKLRKRTSRSMRDGMAWLQVHFSVTTNPGHPAGSHHLYYLYGLERMGMLADRRFIGSHDWYKEGAELLLSKQTAAGAWGNYVPTSFAILFLKRATRGPAVQTTGG
jgi:hypothetical protein